MTGLDLLSGSDRKAIVVLAVVVALLLTGIGCYLWGNRVGSAAATATGKAELNELKAAHATAVSDSLAKALKRSEELVAQGNKISADLIATRAELSATRDNITRSIPDAVRDVPTDCVIGPRLVVLFNRAFGLHSPCAAEADGTGGAGNQTDVPGSAPGGVCKDASIEDLAYWLRDVGRAYGDHAARADKAVQLLEAWSK